MNDGAPNPFPSDPSNGWRKLANRLASENSELRALLKSQGCRDDGGYSHEMAELVRAARHVWAELDDVEQVGQGARDRLAEMLIPFGSVES